MLDQSQKAAAPLPPVKSSELVRQLRQSGTQVAEISEDAKENRSSAAAEIALIFELKELASFKWFERTFIDPVYQRAFDELRNPAIRQPGETLENVQARYVALREVKVGMIERERSHRELLDPTDQEIVCLREKLNLL